MFKKTLVIGLGLIGGSFVRALKKHNLSDKIYACDPDSDSLDLAKQEAVINDGKEDLSLFAEELAQFDLIVLSSPPATYDDVLAEVFEYANDKCLILDLASVETVRTGGVALPARLSSNFVFCHPIAGSEKNGFENSSAELFSAKKFMLCKDGVSDASLKLAASLVEKIGASSDLSLSAARHNEVYALMSHLPQFLSFLTAEFSPKEIHNSFLQKAFRLDNSSPDIWEGEDGIFALNEENLEKFYLIFFDNLSKFYSQFSQQKFNEIINEVSKLSNLLNSQAEAVIEESVLEQNFTAIFLRILIIASYLKIPAIAMNLNYAGNGFKDFTSLIALTKQQNQQQQNAMLAGLHSKNNQRQILKMLENIVE